MLATSKKNMTNAEYRAHPAISNSDLGRFMDWRMGRTNSKVFAQKALDFGTMVHAHILEPNPLNVTTPQVDEVVAALRAHPWVSWVVRFSKKETPFFGICPETRLPLKGKLDLIWKGQIIVDLKTTSAATEKAFVADFVKYSYDRQAAFYLDLTGAKRFVFVGISKKNGQIWVVEATPEMVATGRKKYKRILQEIEALKWHEHYEEQRAA